MFPEQLFRSFLPHCKKQQQQKYLLSLTALENEYTAQNAALFTNESLWLYGCSGCNTYLVSPSQVLLVLYSS